MTRYRLASTCIAAMLLFLHAGLDAGAATFVVDSTVDSPDVTPGDGLCQSVATGNPCTLRAAVQEANALVGRDRIEVPAGIHSLLIPGTDDAAALGDLDVTDALEVVGQPGAEVRALADQPIFDVIGALLVLDSLELSGTGGVGVRTDSGSVLRASRSFVSDMDVGFDLGGVSTLREVTIEGMADGLYGSGISNMQSLTLVSQSELRDNTCPPVDNVWGLILDRTLVKDSDCSLAFTFFSDVVNEGGGALWVNSSSLISSLPTINLLTWESAETELTRATVRRIASDSVLEPFDISVRSSVMDSCLPTYPEKPSAFVVPLTSLGYNVEDASWQCLFLASDLQASVPFTVDDIPSSPGVWIDSGDPALCAGQDRRGFARRSGAGCDRGAIEVGSTFACANGLDDDGDGFVDLQDPGCRDAQDPVEGHVRPGDVLSLNAELGSLNVFDPRTTHESVLVIESVLAGALDLEADSDGRVWVSDDQMGVLTEVDPEDGSAWLHPGGVHPTGVAISAAGQTLVGDRYNTSVLELDTITDSLVTVANDAALTAMTDVEFAPSGDLLVATEAGGIKRLDPSTGSILETLPSGFPYQIAPEPNGDILVADEADGAPVLVDGTTGTRDILVFPAFGFVRGVVREPSGMVLTTSTAPGVYFRTDPAVKLATVLNVGREQPGLGYLELVESDAALTLTLTDWIVVDGGTPGTADVGDTIALTAVVTNVGTTAADLLSLESGLDPNLTLVAGSLTASQGTIVEGSLASDPRVEVDLGTLAPAASATVSWQVAVSDPAPARSVSANAWIRRGKLVLAESDDPSTAPGPDPNVIGVGDYGIVVQAVQKISETRGGLSGPGNPGGVLRQSSYFGGSAEPLGDIDGDGVGDVAVGAYYDDEGGGPGYGAFSIMYLNADGTVKDQRKFSATSPDLALVLALAGLTLGPDNFGSGIANLGDLDGAGPSDFALAVSAWYDDTGGTDRGAVYILFMDASPLQVLSVTKIADGVGGFPAAQLSDYDYFGNGIENIGDVDGDGVTDLAVGAHLDDTIATNSGGVWILFLTPAGTVKASPAPQIIFAPAPVADDYFGLGIAALGLFDGDAIPDIAVSVTRRDTGGLTDAGAVVITTLNADGTVKTQTEIAPGVGGLPLGLLEDDDRFGRDLETLPDLDGDGTVELLVGANRDSDAAFRAGATFVLFLAPAGTVDRAVQLAPQPGVLFHELGEEDRFGLAIAPLGDLDADGDPEIAVGALFDNDGASDAGAVYVLHTATPVPEPGALLGLGCGIALLAALDRKRGRP